MKLLSLIFATMVSASEFSNDFVVDGLVAATFTAMYSNGSVNLELIPDQAKQLKEDGVNYPFVCGTTGESLSLTLKERMAIAEEWSKLPDKDLSLIVHVGAESVMDAVELAKHAQKIGAKAIASMPSVFFKASSVSNLVERMATIAAGAPNLPFFYYHIPSMTGTLVGHGIEEFLSEAASKIPTFAGIKFTDYDLMALGNMIRYTDSKGKKYQLLFGRDEEMYAALELGVIGFVGSTYNYAGKLYNRIIQGFKDRNFTAMIQNQARSQEFISIFKKYSNDNVNANKALLGMMGKPEVGPPRLPATEISKDARSAMDKDLQKIGFYEWA